MLSSLRSVPFLLIFLFAIVYIQRFWFKESRNWADALGKTRGLDPQRVRSTHRVLFWLLMLALVIAEGAQRYHVGRLHWWFTALMSAYFFISFTAGYLLVAVRLVDRFVATRKRTGATLQTPLAQPRREFLRIASTVAVAAPAAACVYGIARERLEVKVDHVNVGFGAKGAGLRGRSIVQISDIHIGPYFTQMDLRRVVDTINDFAPDLVFLTGDFVTFEEDSQYDCVRELKRLRPREAIFGCLGNHEIYTHTEDSITKLFAVDGVDILRYTGRKVRLGNAEFNIAGIDFFRNQYANLIRRVAPYFHPNQVNILLTHNPNAFDFLGDMPVDLCISGHTHGGQMRVEFVDVDVTPARLITSYVSGLYERNGRRLYVNRGLGTIGMPIRLGSPPEITLYHLT